MNVNKKTSILVAGAGGFIGGHLVQYLKNQGYQNIRAVDIKPFDKWLQLDQEVENLKSDLREKENCHQATKNIDEVYNLAAIMGGIGFIGNHKSECMLNVLINTNLLLAARDQGVKRFFFSSSACVYAANKQIDPSNPKLKEKDAYPAMPEDGYGWEKLFSERMCRHFREDYGLQTRVARFHNVYGPKSNYQKNKSKAPAALTRKVIEAKLSGKHEINIWGDGKQTRTFMFIDDCVKGIELIMHSDIKQPVNLGSNELVSINQFVNILEKIAGIKLKRNYKLDAAQGVRGRSSDNTLIKQKLNWEPATPLKEGVEKLYHWLYQELS